ncbi:MAG: hypothetical protein AAFN40_14215 [Cyanobacteria bacterium J06560_6]
MRKAIITLAIGDKYLKRWKRLCATNWQKYADKHNYDIVCIDYTLDNSPRARLRSPAWQKCLILSENKVQKYDQVVWIDSDILINPNAPCVIEGVPEAKIGATDAFEQFIVQSPHKENYIIQDEAVSQLKWKFNTAEDYYRLAKLPVFLKHVMQTGVMVLSPKFHRHILEYTYNNYDNTPVGDFEMESLSYEAIKNDLIHWIDPKFNYLWTACMINSYPFLMPPEKNELKPIRLWKRFTRGHYQLPPNRITKTCLSIAFQKSWFLHFAGATQYMFWASSVI